MPSGKILIIDDEKNIRKTLGLVLEGEGYEVIESETAEEGLLFFESDDFDLIILDIKLPGMSGVEMLKHLSGKTGGKIDIPVIVISGHASLEEAVEVIKQGASDFFEKPLDRNAILIRVANCLKQYSLNKEVIKLRAQVGIKNEMLGHSRTMEKLMTVIQKVAPTKSRVLITGESGTGKELIARAIHKFSTRQNMPFIKVNCAAIPGELIESELFGYEKGAFTGAVKRKAGHFELADEGTIFLDEIADMSLAAQAKVLRVLQSGELTRVGGIKSTKVDVRVLAATNKSLDNAVENGSFREDLYFRINVVPVKASPLREHPEDIEELINSFVKLFCDENGYAPKIIDKSVIKKLGCYSWPGNVRELKNIAERLVIMGDCTITLEDLPEYITGGRIEKRENISFEPETSVTLKEYKEKMEHGFIISSLKNNEWNISKTARALGIERTNLHKKIKSLNIKRR